MSKSYCMRCKKRVSENTDKCECGSKSFIFGDKFHFTGKSIVCDCGCDQFSMGFHADKTKSAITNYSCKECGNVVGIESFRSEEDLMYWEDDDL